MSRIFFISGSPRKGNTEFVLKKIYDAVIGDKELVLLRDKNIGYCQGCFYCHKHKKCAVDDDMQEMYEKMVEADIYVIGTPNYYDNVPGLLKSFIDRLNPLFGTGKLKDKKLITIVVGGGKIENSQRVSEHALKYFAQGHKINLIGEFCFQALKLGELKNNAEANREIENIIQKINSL